MDGLCTRPRPAWILQAFALQNVVCWLVLAWLITRWVPPDSPRLFARWAACMFSHGLLWSVRFSLLDGPSVLLQLTTPFRAYLGNWQSALTGVQLHGLTSLPMQALLVVIALTVQAIFLIWSRLFDQPWWRLAAAYAALMLIVHPVVWHGYPGAITRVVLPLTFGFNILLARRGGRAFWIWFVLGNLHLVPAQNAMPIPGLPSLL